jgi:hypothetical protein
MFGGVILTSRDNRFHKDIFIYIYNDNNLRTKNTKIRKAAAFKPKRFIALPDIVCSLP